MTTLWVLGIDPGAVSGWGLLRADGLGLPALALHGCVKGYGGEIEPVVSNAQCEAQQTDRLVLACEAQFVKDSRSMDTGKRMGQQRAALSVAAVRGKWLGIAEASGAFASAFEVHPTTWREAMLGRGWGSRPRVQCKTQALAVVAGLWGLRLAKSHDHTAEALLIAAYAAKEILLKEAQWTPKLS